MLVSNISALHAAAYILLAASAFCGLWRMYFPRRPVRIRHAGLMVILAGLLVGLPIFSGQALAFYLVSIFGAPAPLTVCLALQVFLPAPLRLHRKAMGWILIMAMLILASALSLPGFAWPAGHFYHQQWVAADIYLTGAVFALVFLPAFWIDHKTIWMMWLTLLAYMGAATPSSHLLDSVADVWLFLWAIGTACAWLLRQARAVLCRLKTSCTTP